MSEAGKNLFAATQPVPDLYMEDADGNELPGVVVEWGGKPIKIPEKALHDDALRMKMFAGFRQTPEFASYYNLDTKRGSPATVRAVVGSSSRAEDKLAAPVRLFAGCPYR
jgi:hypothetical protein